MFQYIETEVSFCIKIAHVVELDKCFMGLHSLLLYLQCNDDNPVDWRAALIQRVHQVFRTERELLLQEMRTFLSAKGDLKPTEAQRLESRIQTLVSIKYTYALVFTLTDQ